MGAARGHEWWKGAGGSTLYTPRPVADVAEPHTATSIYISRCQAGAEPSSHVLLQHRTAPAPYTEACPHCLAKRPL